MTSLAYRLARSPRWRRLLGAGLSVAPLLLSACMGALGDPQGGDPQGAEGDGDGPVPGGARPEEVAARSMFPRLSHVQWENTVRDLLRLDDRPGLSASFTTDPLGGVFDNNEAALQVTPGLWSDYQRAAEELAAMVAADQGKLDRIAPAGLPDEPEARAQAFVERFGERAFRRPLTDDERDVYVALFHRGKELFKGEEPFVAGVRAALEAFLQSPHFVYRVELGAGPTKNGLIPLSGHEIATKLAYLFWNTMPDDDLLAAAKAGELSTPEAVRAYAERMLEDPRAREVIGSFHRQLYDFDHYHDLNKDQALYPEFVPEMGDDMEREAELFVEHIVFDKEGGLTDLLTDRTAFVNERLATVYGVEGQSSNDFKQVELDGDERAGLLTRLGFLASKATARQPDSIHRGVFVNLRVICAALPPPPDNATSLPPGEHATNRERVEAHTGKGTCGEACHGTMINPAGFAFEHYDAIGKYRTIDNGMPVNAADVYRLGGEPRSYANAMEFSRVLAESSEAHACYAKRWVEFAHGRDARDKDRDFIRKLGDASRGGASTKDLLLQIVSSTSFLARVPAEAQ
ncbi:MULTISPECIES: DUF1592 domain-containing protein [Sorangium]|uniref:Secreted protein n=1 Tax=Sorangium cellulosum TaxID=56 RepID=A0A4P2QFN5_SORCE|nr:MULTISPECIES: DUF1592 domain-containing protein [Sorangium]AUX28291.1 hypothetical protein SOCE836_003610 [Sorangium cellulosum]WCQ87685.1 hypothetical protein NQZ70_00348 [Sorangium sp. Soce836]